MHDSGSAAKPPAEQPTAEPDGVERDERTSLLGLDAAELQQEVGDRLRPAFRLRQLDDALHRQVVRSFGEATSFSLEDRAWLDSSFSVGRPRLVDRVPSADGTEKSLFELQDGATIESVDIPDGARRTFCISSQAGCALACRFCVTGYWGAGRNLTAGEIIGQVYSLREQAELPWERINLVFMGMGEPLLNLDPVRRALDKLTLHIPWPKITVSTAGLVPGIREMASWDERPNLAVSLHAADDVTREQIMPINRKYPLDDLFEALAEYPVTRSRKLTFEYILIRGLNDTPRHARDLVRRLHGLRSRVNLIPFNPDPVLGDLAPPDENVVDAFRQSLVDSGVRAVVRRPRGDDVAAACGQLRAFGRRPRGFPGIPSTA